MADNSNKKLFKASSTIFDNHTEIVWNSPICAFSVERTLIDGGDGRWEEEIGWIPANRRSFSMGNSSEISKFQYRIVAKMINEITLTSESTGISSLGSKVTDEIGDEGTTPTIGQSLRSAYDAIFKASSTIFEDRTEISWNSPICAFFVERTLIDGGDGRWEEIGRVPADRISFSLANSSEISKFEYRVVAKMINDITLTSESTGIPTLDKYIIASKCNSEIGELDDGITLDCEPMCVQHFVPPIAPTVKERPVKKKKAPALVPTIAPTPPGPPQGPLSYEWISPRLVKVSWNPPSDDGGSPITSYLIQIVVEMKITWPQIMEINGNKTSASLKLKTCKYQQFGIVAVNARGRSAPLITKKLRVLPPPAPEVEIDSSNQNYIELNWTFPDRPKSENATVRFCYIRRRVGRGGGEFVQIGNNITDNSYRDFDVVPGQKYKYEVFAIGTAAVVSSTKTKRIRFKCSKKQPKRLRKKVRKQLEMAQEKASIQEDPMQSNDQVDEPGPSSVKQVEVQEQQEIAPVKQEVGDSEVEPDTRGITFEIDLD